MEYHWIEDIEEFRNIAIKWDDALINSDNYNPFLLSDFIITWWKYFSDNLTLRIFIIYDNGKIVGGIPLYMSRGRFREGFTMILRYIGGSAANYTEPLYATDGLRILEILEEALAKRNDWSVLQLTDVRAGNRLIDEYHDYPQDGHFKLYIVQDHMNWSIDLSNGKENYFATISKKLRRDLRSKRRHILSNYGKLQLKEIKGKEDVEKYFDLYIKFSLHTFTSRNRRSTLEDKKYANFLKDFLVLMDGKERLDGHALIAGDKVMAISFGYRFGKGFNWVLTGFNYDYKYFRPGYLLIEELINNICNHGETYYNWYGHERFYKTQFCNEQSPLFQFLIVNSTLGGFCYMAIKRAEIVAKSNRILRIIAKKIMR